MISDVLSEAINGMDKYLDESLYDDVYAGELRDKILRLKTHIERVKIELKNPPITLQERGCVEG